MIKRNIYFLVDQLYLSNGANANSSEHIITKNYIVFLVQYYEYLYNSVV